MVKRSSKAGALSSPRNIAVASILISISSFFLLPDFLYPSYLQMIQSMLYFIACPYLLGYTLTAGIFDSKDLIEKIFMRIGFGLAAQPLLFVFLEIVDLNLNWMLVLGLSAIRPAFDLFTLSDLNLKHDSLDYHSAIAFLLFSIIFSFALYGSYQFPYLEDGDSWEHAVGVKYISIYGSYTQKTHLFAHYLPPIYPPGYDTMLGLTHQLNESVNWTLKVFNSLLVALSYIFGFFFFKKIMKSSGAALASTFMLFMLPPFGSHAIWAHTLSAALFFPVFYSLEFVDKNKTWILLSPIFLAGSLLVQPFMSAIMGVFYIIYFISKHFSNKKNLLIYAGVGFFALSLSMIFWIPAFNTPAYKSSELNDWIPFSESSTSSGLAKEYDDIDSMIAVTKQNMVLPTVWDLFFPKSIGDIYMQPGFGLFPLILIILCIDFAIREKNFLKYNKWFIYTFLWFIFSIISLLSIGISFDIYHSRFWGIGSIPIAMISGYLIANLDKKKFIPKKYVKHILYIIVFGVLITSFYPKFQNQTRPWPTDLFYKSGDSEAYLRLVELLPTHSVYAFCTKDAYVIGFDKMAHPWDEEIYASRGSVVADPKKLSRLLRPRNVRNVIFDINCIKRCVAENKLTSTECREQMHQNLESLEASGLFKMTWKSNSTMIFEVK